MGKGLKNLERILRGRGACVESHPFRIDGSEPSVTWLSRTGKEYTAFGYGDEVELRWAILSPYRAVLATLGPVELPDEPHERRYVSFGNLGMNLPDDGAHVLLDDQNLATVSAWADHMCRKVSKQKESLRNLHRKVIKLHGEIDELRRMLAVTAIRDEGYAEGE